jgi:hypothetical protein
MAEPSALDDQLKACECVGRYLQGEKLIADTHVQQILIATLDRSTAIFEAIAIDVRRRSTLPAAMLMRPLFEDMACTP